MRQMDTPRVFVLRMHVGEDNVPYGLEANRITVGWSKARGLIEVTDHYAIRERVREVYSRDKRWAGKAAGVLRRFLHLMQPGDHVLVPRGSEVFFAKVDGPPGFDEEREDADTAYYRPVQWMNQKKGYPRGGLPSKLQLAVGMGTRNTLRDITFCLPEVLEVEKGIRPTDTPFQTNLHNCLSEEALKLLREGNMNDRAFEVLVRDLFEGLGAKGEVRGRRYDKGADIVLDLPLGRFLSQRVAIQVKYRPDPKQGAVGRDAVDDVVRGMDVDAEDADLGIVVTNGLFSAEARKAAEECDHTVHLVDGNLLASMIVEVGVSPHP